MIQSCLWRAANSRELDYRSSPDLSKSFADIVERLVHDYSLGSSNSSIDFLIGIAMGKILLSSEVVKSLMSKVETSLGGNQDIDQLIGYIQKKYFPSTQAPSATELPF